MPPSGRSRRGSLDRASCNACRHSSPLRICRRASASTSCATRRRPPSTRPLAYGLIVGSTGASRADTLESRAMTYVTLPSGSPLTIDIPPGSRIDLNPGRQVALRAAQRDAFYSDYSLQPQPAGGAPLLDAAITHATLNHGRAVYWGFELRDVVSLPWDRALGALLVRNSVAWAAGLPTASIEPWPKGRAAAATIAQDVEASFSNAQYALDSLSAARVPATFFVTSNLARDYT